MKTKTYVITGSASGIGKELVKKLAADNVIFAGYRNKLHESELKLISPNVFPFYVDYSKPETIKEATDYILSKCTKIDTLVNIAGCVVGGPVENVDMNEVRRQFDVNVFGHLELSQNLIPVLSDGRIINVSSMASFGLFPFIAPYAASKRCLDMFFNNFLMENKKNIKVISIKPGIITTPLWGKSIDDNSKFYDNYSDYSEEMKYVIANAQRNSVRGLPPDRVADVIIKADRAKKPKLSYTVGGDALLAKYVAMLPQNVINSIVKAGIRIKIFKNKKV